MPEQLEFNFGPIYKRILVFNLNIGQLPPYKAEAYVDRKKDELKYIIDHLPADCAVLFNPVREGPSKVEVLELTEHTKEEKLENLKWKVLAENPQLLGEQKQEPIEQPDDGSEMPEIAG